MPSSAPWRTLSLPVPPTTCRKGPEPMRDTNTTLTTSTSFQENRALDAHVIRLDRQHELGLEVLCLADVTPKPIDWLWRNWFARGKVHVLAGEGGRGKSTILCDIASRTTRGEPWP